MAQRNAVQRITRAGALDTLTSSCSHSNCQSVQGTRSNGHSSTVFTTPSQMFSKSDFPDTYSLQPNARFLRPDSLSYYPVSTPGSRATEATDETN